MFPSGLYREVHKIDRSWDKMARYREDICLQTLFLLYINNNRWRQWYLYPYMPIFYNFIVRDEREPLFCCGEVLCRAKRLHAIIFLVTFASIRHVRFINILNMPRLRGFRVRNVNWLVSFVSQLGYKENHIEYRSSLWKPRRHVRILIYRTWSTAPSEK